MRNSRSEDKMLPSNSIRWIPLKREWKTQIPKFLTQDKKTRIFYNCTRRISFVYSHNIEIDKNQAQSFILQVAELQD